MWLFHLHNERVSDSERTVDASRSLGENDTCKFPFFVIPKRGKKLIVFNVTKNGGRSIKATQGNITCAYDSLLILPLQRWENILFLIFTIFSSKNDSAFLVSFQL